jgi:hypothetical protein
MKITNLRVSHPEEGCFYIDINNQYLEERDVLYIDCQLFLNFDQETKQLLGIEVICSKNNVEFIRGKLMEMINETLNFTQIGSVKEPKIDINRKED